MIKLCCVVNTAVTCTLCNEKWCDNHWAADRTHGGENFIARCPLDNVSVTYGPYDRGSVKVLVVHP